MLLLKNAISRLVQPCYGVLGVIIEDVNYFRIAEGRMVAAFPGCVYINGSTGPTGPTGPSDTRAAAAVADATSVEDVVEQFKIRALPQMFRKDLLYSFNFMLLF